jgi:hypothetical protein
MPSVSKQQQKLFGLVHAYQQGKVPADKVSTKIKKIAKSISPEDAKKYASTSHAELKEVLHTILHSPKYTELTLSEIVKTQNPSMVKGQLIDVFTAQLLCTVMTKLNENNKNDLLQCPVNQMVAVAYKVLTY